MKKKQQKEKIKDKNPQQKFQKPQNQVISNRLFNLIGLTILILLGLITYSNSFTCSFHFDDSFNILENTSIQNLSDVKSWWKFNPSRPISIFTFVLNYHFNQLDVRYWHAVNLAIHLTNACLVWWLSLLIFSSPVMKDQSVVRHRKFLAIITALLFVSHPLATQTITYIVQRMNALATMFYLLSIAFYVKARLLNKDNVSRTLLFTGSLISAVFAMLSKENAFTLPFAIMLFEIYFLRTKKVSINFKDYRLILLVTVLLGLALIIPLTNSLNVLKPIPPSVWHSYNLTPFNYLLTQFSVILKYIQLLFLPIAQRVDYDFPIADNFFEIRTLLSFLALLALIILAIYLFKRNRIISFGIFWFLITLSVESSFIPINDVIVEHRTYLPSFGFFLILSSVLYILLWNTLEFLKFTIIVFIIGSFSIMTFERNKVWKDEVTLWNDNVGKTPNLARPVNNRGVAYWNIGRYDNAIADYSRAIEINPQCKIAYFNRGIIYGILKKWDKAVADNTKAIEGDRKSAKGYYNRGIAYGNLGEWDKAIADYTMAIEFDPQYSDAYSNRGGIYGNKGQWDKAIADYTKAIEINRRFTNAYSNRGVAYGNLGKWDLAIVDYTRAIEIDPKYPIGYINRGVAYGNLGQWNKALTDYSIAINLDPNYSIAYFNRGIVNGKLRQLDKAIADYSNAIRIDPRYAKAYYYRSIAYGNLGQQDKARDDYLMATRIDPNFSAGYNTQTTTYKKPENNVKH